MIISRVILLGMRDFSDRICEENIKIYFMFNHFFFENRAISEIMWKNVVQHERLRLT